MEKRSLVLLPGLLCDTRLWRDQIEDLSDVASPIVADLSRDNSMEAMAERVLAAAPSTFALAALSMRGYVAFEIMRRAPERVTRLALLDTSAAPDSHEQLRWRKAGLTALQFGRFSGVTSKLMPNLVHASKLDSPLSDDIKAMAARLGKDAFIRQQIAILGRPDSRPDLARIRIPTLVAVWDSDTLTPMEHALELHHRILQSVLHVFENCGHMPPIEAPRETSAVLRTWLTATS